MTDWDDSIPATQLALNTKLNDSSKSSPASLLFGMDVNAFANYDRVNSKLLTENQLIERAKVIAEIFRAAQKKRTDAVNAKLRLTENVTVGSLVMLRDPTRTSKNQPPWLGPYRMWSVRRKVARMCSRTLTCPSITVSLRVTISR